MRTTAIALALAACTLAWDAGAQSTLYRWVDKDGKVHFTDSPPPDDAANVQQKRYGSGYVEEGQLPYATQMAMKRYPVSVFTSNGCGDLCTQGRALLTSRGIPYTERNAEANPADAEALKGLIGALQVPLLVVGDKTVRGFDEGNWNAALDAAGYPRTKLPGQISPRQPAPEPAPEASAAPK